MFAKIRGEFEAKKSGYTKEHKSCPSASEAKIQTGYVELIGSIRPKALKGAAPVVVEPTVANGLKKAKVVQEKATVYEYCWCVGASGDDAEWYSKLNGNDPMVVQLLFHTANSRYYVQEVAADLKLIPPFFKAKPGELQEIVDRVRPWGEAIGTGLEIFGQKAAGKLISSISKKKRQSTVPEEKFPWYIKMFSFGTESGIEWHIPQTLIEATGNRLVGSVGITFTDVSGLNTELEETLSIEARAFLRDGNGKELFLSATDKPLLLSITPE